jgi:hypothetical protein
MSLAKLSRAIFLALLLCLASTIFVAAETPAAQPASPQAPAPQTPLAAIDLQLSFQGASNVGGFEVEIVYDTAQSLLTGVTLSDLLGKTTGCSAAATRCASGLGPLQLTDRTRIGAYSYGSGSGANGGVLAVLHFESSLPVDALSPTLANALVVDAFGEPIQGATLTLAAVERKSYLPLIQKK